MKLTQDQIDSFASPFFRSFISYLNELIGDTWDIKFHIYRPSQGGKPDITGITKKTALILWGDEHSQIFPTEYLQAAGAVIKCYCPESWLSKGIIPMTDNAMIYAENNNQTPTLCSTRPYTVFFSANLNYRRTDIFRALSQKSFAYPFRISSNYPETGKYPLWHKVEAVAMHKIITRLAKTRDFSNLYPNSYIRFHDGFMKGSLSAAEYEHRLFSSKVSWCTAGFMTNETSRLIESAFCGTAVICGRLPNTPIYQGHPFLVIEDWRKVRTVTDELLNDTARLDELGTLGRQWFDTHFSPKAQACRIAEVLKTR